MHGNMNVQVYLICPMSLGQQNEFPNIYAVSC